MGNVSGCYKNSDRDVAKAPPPNEIGCQAPPAQSSIRNGYEARTATATPAPKPKQSEKPRQKGSEGDNITHYRSATTKSTNSTPNVGGNYQYGGRSGGGHGGGGGIGGGGCDAGGGGFG